MTKRIRRLPDAELVVMQAVWRCQPPVLRADLERELSPEHLMASTTLLTQLSRLTKKGFLITEKSGKGNCYTPTITKEQYLSSQSRQFVEQLCGGSVSVLASALCDSGLSEEELAQLRHLLEKGAL